MHMRRDKAKPKTRGDALRDALVPLATKGVTGEEGMALIMAAGSALRQGVGLGWAEIEMICDDVFKEPKP